MVRVSICIPIFNSASTLEACLQSVFAQTFTDWELLLFDDGSTDGSWALVERLADPRVRRMRGDRNLGCGPRLNEMAQLARGDYLARMDADDMMHPDRIGKEAAFLDAHPDIDVVDCEMILFDGDLSAERRLGLGPLHSSPYSFLGGRRLLHAACMARKGWLREHPYDAAYRRAEDFELWTRTFGSIRVARLQEALCFYGLPRNGPDYFGKYAETCRTDRRILRRYGPALVGWWRTLTLIGQSRAKEEVYRLATLAGVQERLTSRRGVPLSRREADAARAVVESILATRLPMETGLPLASAHA